VRVAELVTRPGDAGVPHVTGVLAADGSTYHAELVVDASGRRSGVAGMLAAARARRPVEEREEAGFVYYCRHFRSRDGRYPAPSGPLLQHFHGFSVLTLPADGDTWGVGFVTSSRDRSVRGLRDTAAWDRSTALLPQLAPWCDGEPITDVQVIAGIEDCRRRFVVDGDPVANGLLAVGDAWACTNPSVGRGASFALLHAVGLRDVLREVGPNDPGGFARRWHEATQAELGPWVSDTIAFDRHRLAQIDAEIAGVPYVTEDPAWNLGTAMRGVAARDPDVLRAFMSVAAVLTRGVDVFAWPGILDKVLALGDPEPPPGPDRGELLAIVQD
jgi:hypothetical protein